MKLLFEIYNEGNDTEFSVEFEAFPKWENDGIGSYEYWGAKGYDFGSDYISLEYNGDPTWDTLKHTEEENRLIEQIRDSSNVQWQRLCERFCDEYKEEVTAK
jgi:hypothetical protein